VACYLLLLLARFSWWLLLLPPVADVFLFMARHGFRTGLICPSCPAREDCPLWERFGNARVLERSLSRARR